MFLSQSSRLIALIVSIAPSILLPSRTSGVRPRRPNPWYALVVVVLLFLGGCGGGGDDDSRSDSPPAPAEQNALDISVFGEGDIRVQGAIDRQLDCTRVTMCQGMFDQGDEVVLIAEPDSGWTHDSWTGCDRQDEPDQCTVFIDGDRLVSVTFLSADPLEFDDAVVVLRDDQLQGLIDYNLDTGRLVFSATTDGASQWAIGTILLAAEDPDEGLTLARRIMDIQRNGSRIVFSTEQASLEEIFRSGSFSYGMASATVSPQSRGPIVTQGEANKIPIDVDFGSGVSATGSLEFPVNPQFDVNFSPFEYRIIMHAEPAGSIDVEVSGSVQISRQRQVFEKKFRPRWIATVSLGRLRVPVIVVPTLKVFLDAKIGASAAVGIGMSVAIDAAAGVHYKDGKLNRILEAEVDPMYRVSGGVDWNAEMGVRSELHFSLYGWRPSPYVAFIPYLGVRAGCKDSFAQTYKGWRVGVGDLPKIIGEFPPYDSNPNRLPQSQISLSRMPSGGAQCPEMPDETPSPDPGPTAGATCSQLTSNPSIYTRHLTCRHDFPDRYEGQHYRFGGICTTLQLLTSEEMPLCPRWGPFSGSECVQTESSLLEVPGSQIVTCPG